MPDCLAALRRGRKRPDRPRHPCAYRFLHAAGAIAQTRMIRPVRSLDFMRVTDQACRQESGWAHGLRRKSASPRQARPDRRFRIAPPSRKLRRPLVRRAPFSSWRNVPSSAEILAAYDGRRPPARHLALITTGRILGACGPGCPFGRGSAEAAGSPLLWASAGDAPGAFSSDLRFASGRGRGSCPGRPDDKRPGRTVSDRPADLHCELDSRCESASRPGSSRLSFMGNTTMKTIASAALESRPLPRLPRRPEPTANRSWSRWSSTKTPPKAARHRRRLSCALATVIVMGTALGQ